MWTRNLVAAEFAMGLSVTLCGTLGLHVLSIAGTRSGMEPTTFKLKVLSDPGPWTLDNGPWTLNPEPWTLDPQPWTLDPELNPGP